MLSIQYVYERVILFCIACFLKRVQKYKFILISQVLNQKKINYFFILILLTQSINELVILPQIIGTAKVNPFFISGKLFLKKLMLFLNLFNHQYTMNFAFIAGAKVVAFFYTTNLFVFIFYLFSKHYFTNLVFCGLYRK